MLPAFLWYLATGLLGLAVFPLSYCLLPALPDRGYAVSRTLGLLLWGYLFWMLGSLQIAANDAGGQTLALLVVLGLSAWALSRAGWRDLLAWLSARRGLVLSVEGVFLVGFALLALVRAASPEIVNTEKPMEMAFIQSILRSPDFPAHDPWLSGYAISYYHFGYILVAMLARFTGTPGPVAFNLGIALVFALASAGVYGLVYNLLAAWRGEREGTAAGPTGLLGLALLGPLFVQVLGNLEGLLEIMHRRRWFWNMEAAGGPTSAFWSWLDIQDLKLPPSLPLDWVPRNYGTGSWWWWRASRVVSDYRYDGSWVEVIDEFPAFSYLLADLHPHMLAVPFAFLAIALALNMFLGGSRGRIGHPDTGLGWHFGWKHFLLAGVVLGGLGFLNLWDFPIYVAIFAGAYSLRQAALSGWGWNRLTEFLVLCAALIFAGLALYLPFYLGFSSQAGGLLPSTVYFTRGAHLWVMFGGLLLPLAAFLLYLWSQRGGWRAALTGLAAVLAIFGALGLVSLLLVLVIQNVDRLQVLNPLAGMAESIFLGSLAAPTSPDGAHQWEPVLREALQRRLAAPGGWLTLAALLLAALGLLPRCLAYGGSQPDQELDEAKDPVGGQAASPAAQAPATPIPFVLLLVVLGALLVLGPEFVYLRDQFGSRMNTIFKFYFQAWLLWGAAAAFGSALLLRALPRLWNIGFGLLLAAVVTAGLLYPAFWGWERLHGLKPPDGWTLDGSEYIQRTAPSEAAAIDWLKQAPLGALAEAVGGQYSDFARLSVYSGQPAVLGWPGHESQWRGGSVEMGSRQEDMQRLYTTRDWEEAQAILEQYDIRYVALGPRERQTYRVSETKFQRYLTEVFRQGDMLIYRYP